MDGRPLHDLMSSLRTRDDITNPTNPSSIQISKTLEIALIAGGGGLLLLIPIFVTWCIIRRRRKKRSLPEASSPIGGFFNPNALPENPLASQDQQHQRNISNISNPIVGEPQMGVYRRQSLNQQNQPPAGGMYNGSNDFALRSQTPLGGGYGQMQQVSGMPPPRGMTPGPQDFDAQQQGARRLSQRRGNEGPAPLRLNTKLRAPSGVGLERVNATAWGVRGRHVDAEANYYGSVANQGGYAPENNKRLPPMPALPKQYGAPQQEQPAVYGDDDTYAAQYEEREQRPLDRYATPEPLRYGTPQPPRYATPQAPPPAATNPYRQDMGNPYAAAASRPQNASNAYGGANPNAGNSWAPNGYGHNYNYSDAASTRYGGHSRQVSDDREHAPTGWI